MNSFFLIYPDRGQALNQLFMTTINLQSTTNISASGKVLMAHHKNRFGT